MKRILAGCLAGTVIIGSVVGASAQETTNNMEDAYYKIVRGICDEHGEPGVMASVGTWYSTGLSALSILDFDGDGNEDLLTAYFTGTTEVTEDGAVQVMPQYMLQIWSAKEGEPELLYETDFLGEARNSYGVLYGNFVSVSSRDEGGDIIQFTNYEGELKELTYYNTFMDGGEITTDKYVCGAGGFSKNGEVIDGHDWINEICGSGLIYFTKLAEYGYSEAEGDLGHTYDGTQERIKTLMEELSTGEATVPEKKEEANLYRRLLLTFDVYENHSTLYNMDAHANMENQDYSDTEVGRILKETLSQLDEGIYQEIVDYQSLQYFDYSVYDVNKDGIAELLVSNHIRHGGTSCYVFSVDNGNLIYCGCTEAYRTLWICSETEPGVGKYDGRDMSYVEAFNINNGNVEEYVLSDASTFTHHLRADYPKMLEQLLY